MGEDKRKRNKEQQTFFLLGQHILHQLQFYPPPNVQFTSDFCSAVFIADPRSQEFLSELLWHFVLWHIEHLLVLSLYALVLFLSWTAC